MFTGIIRLLGNVVSWQQNTFKVEINHHQSYQIQLGDSIAINGVCLTVTQIVEDVFTFHVMDETQQITTINPTDCKLSSLVNVELSVCASKVKLDGHIVYGHVHTVGVVAKIVGNKWWFKFQHAGLMDHDHDMKHKGSIAINGVSLTIVDVCEPDLVSVCLIPHTIEHTNFHRMQLGNKVNLEFHQTNITHSSWMKYAMKISHQGRISAPPNPWVGCVIVNSYNQVIATGFHVKAGEPHAEVNAFASLSATYVDIPRHLKVFVTLEPCCHTGRTPPCTNLLLQYKDYIQEVIVGITDPDERVSGTGVQLLREAGMNVTVLDSSFIRHDLRGYIHHRRTGMPYLIFKIATSLDLVYTGGRITTHEQAIQDVHQERDRVQCMMTTTKTFNTDHPRLTVRLRSSSSSTSMIERVLPIVVVGDEELYEQREHVLHVPRQTDFCELLKHLGQKGYFTVYVEGGNIFYQQIFTHIHELHHYVEHTLLSDRRIKFERYEEDKFVVHHAFPLSYMFPPTFHLDPKTQNLELKEIHKIAPTTTKTIYCKKQMLKKEE